MVSVPYQLGGPLLAFRSLFSEQSMMETTAHSTHMRCALPLARCNSNQLLVYNLKVAAMPCVRIA